jgi:hypothetical protein
VKVINAYHLKCCAAPDDEECWFDGDADHQTSLVYDLPVNYIAECLPDLPEAVSRGPPGWISRAVESELSFWLEEGYSGRAMEALAAIAAEPNPDGLPQLCIFQIRAGEVKACPYLHDHPFAIGMTFFRALAILAHLVPLPDVDLPLIMDDWDWWHATAPDQHWPAPVLVLSHGLWQPSMASIPANFLLTHRAKIYKLSADDIAVKIAWQEKRSSLFWRGGTTTQWHCGNYLGGNGENRCSPLGTHRTESTLSEGQDSKIFHIDDWDLVPRGRVVLLSSFHPSLIDAKFTNADEFNSRIPVPSRTRGPMRRHEERGLFKTRDVSTGSMMGMFAHKYLFSTDCSDSLYRMLMGTSAVVYPESPVHLWPTLADLELEPLRDYIPVNANLSDLLDRLDWASDHDAAVAQLAASMRNKTRDKLTMHAMLHYLYELIVAIARVRRD